MRVLVVLLILTFSLSALAVEPPATQFEKKVDSLLVIASSGQIKYRDHVQPAKDSLVALGGPAVARLVDHYNTKSARRRHTLTDIVERIGTAGTPYLIEALSGADAEKKSLLCYSLGIVKDTSAVAVLIENSGDPDWRVRSNIATALGEIGDSRAGQTLITMLSDPVEIVRKSAAVSCGKLKQPEMILPLVHLLGDDFYGARLMASQSLVEYGHDAIKPITDSLNSANYRLGNLGCTTLGKIGGDEAGFSVSQQILSNDPIRRALAVEAILHSGSSLACGFVEILAETETDPIVLLYINKVFDRYVER